MKQEGIIVIYFIANYFLLSLYQRIYLNIALVFRRCYYGKVIKEIC